MNRIKVDDQELDYIAFMDKGNDFGNEILWDLNKYINIFIYKFKTEEDNDNTVLGVSHLPYGIESNPLSGVPDGDFYIDKTKPESYAHCISLNNIFIYDYNINGSTTNFVITLTHELGHYLGLLHPFSRSDGEGNKTDYCDDTPDYDRTLYDAWLDGVFNSTPSMTFDQLAQRESTNGDKFNSTNIMDYYYSSNSEFTSDQKKRIRHVLMYSPMIPGPKLSRSTTRSKSTNIAPPMRYIE